MTAQQRKRTVVGVSGQPPARDPIFLADARNSAKPPEEAAPLNDSPGSELHPAVYRTVLAGVAVLVVASWMAFGGGEMDLLLTMAMLILAVLIVIPTLLHLVGRGGNKDIPLDDFLDGRVETPSGPLSGRQAWFQIAMIPIALAFAAVCFAIENAIVGR